jgi:hypothetical protein
MTPVIVPGLAANKINGVSDRFWAYVFNLLMDPMEKMDPHSHEWGYIGRKFFAQKMWVPTAAKQFLAAQIKSLQDFPPPQGADTLSLK